MSKDNTALKLTNPSKLLSSFTRKYPLSKTLRFGLKPIPETKPFLNKFIQSDEQRDKDYKCLKKINEDLRYKKVG